MTDGKKNTPRGRQFEKESVYLPTISNYNILVSMNVQTIGENAGIVYRVLASEHREWSYSEVKEKTGLPDRVVERGREVGGHAKASWASRRRRPDDGTSST